MISFRTEVRLLQNLQRPEQIYFNQKHYMYW